MEKREVQKELQVTKFNGKPEDWPMFRLEFSNAMSLKGYDVLLGAKYIKSEDNYKTMDERKILKIEEESNKKMGIYLIE